VHGYTERINDGIITVKNYTQENAPAGKEIQGRGRFEGSRLAFLHPIPKPQKYPN
jgi:hypothetical protein